MENMLDNCCWHPVPLRLSHFGMTTLPSNETLPLGHQAEIKSCILSCLGSSLPKNSSGSGYPGVLISRDIVHVECNLGLTHQRSFKRYGFMFICAPRIKLEKAHCEANLLLSLVHYEMWLTATEAVSCSCRKETLYRMSV